MHIQKSKEIFVYLLQIYCEKYKNIIIKNNIFLSGTIKFINGINTMYIMGRVSKGAIIFEYLDKLFLSSNALLKN